MKKIRIAMYLLFVLSLAYNVHLYLKYLNSIDFAYSVIIGDILELENVKDPRAREFHYNLAKKTFYDNKAKEVLSDLKARAKLDDPEGEYNLVELVEYVVKLPILKEP